MELVVDAVNRYRIAHNKYWIHVHDSFVSNYCFRHCEAMAIAGHIYHGAFDDWQEVVCMKTFKEGYIEDVINQLVFDVLGNSQEHRNILLGDHHLIAGAAFVKDGLAYITIRLK